MAILETKDLRKIYGSGENEVHALDGVSISVEEGEFVAVIGTSGSGKSTLLNMIGGLDRPTSGSVTIRGKELLKMKDEELTIFRRRNIGFVFQNYNLLPVLNVYENIVYPIEIDGGKTDNFEYTDIQFEQYEQLNKEVPQFDEHFVEQIKQLDGIKNIDVQKTVWAGIDFNENDLEGFMKIKYEDSKYKAKGQSYEQTIETLKGYAESGDYGCYITTLPDDRVLEEYNAEHPDTPIDMEAFKRGETAIAGKDTEYNAPNTALVGETLTLTADSTDGKATDFKIGGAFYYDDYDNTLSEGIGRRKEINMVPDVIFVSEAGMERLTKEPIISAIGVDIKNFNDLERIDSELQAINSTLTTSEWQLKSSVNQKELYNQMNYSLSLLGNGAAILLIVIGLINFVNVMLTGVVARKNEFAIMESIGTTKKQIRKILTLEGGIYALISTLLIMTFGNAFLMLVADAVPHMANYAVFKYPVALVIGLIAAIFVICLSVPAIVYKATSDETVIERLHNFDS